MDPDELFYGRALARIERLMALLGGAATLTVMVYGGWRWAVGFVLGAGASYLNFRWLKQLVNSLGESVAGKAPKKRVAVMLGLRYLLLGLGGYVILNFTALSLA